MRVENLGPNVDAYCQRTGNGSSTYDLCRPCASKLHRQPHIFDRVLRAYNPGEPCGSSGWGGDVERPPYDDMPYQCKVCRRPLVEGRD